MYKWDRWLQQAGDFLLQSAFMIGMAFVNIMLLIMGTTLVIGFVQLMIEVL